MQLVPGTARGGAQTSCLRGRQASRLRSRNRQAKCPEAPAGTAAPRMDALSLPILVRTLRWDSARELETRTWDGLAVVTWARVSR